MPEIAEAVGDKVTIILDSGIRRGSDIVKALALGAKAVLTGRATLYGTAVGGEAGAAKAINIIRTEFDKTMAYTGCNRTDEITTDIFFGDYGSNRMARGAPKRSRSFCRPKEEFTKERKVKDVYVRDAFMTDEESRG